MPDTINVRSQDILKVEGTSSYYVPDGSPGSLPDALGTLIALFQVAEVDLITQTTVRYEDLTPMPGPGDTPLCSEAAEILFICDDASEYLAYVLAPRDGTFDGGGNLDTGQTWVSDLIQWLLDNATNSVGSPLASYVSGRYVTLEPGALDVNGAAQVAARGGIVTDFYSQDGADVKG